MRRSGNSSIGPLKAALRPGRAAQVLDLSGRFFLIPGARDTVGPVRIAPERVHENADRSAGRPNVFNLSGRQPIVDGATADADQLARFHDRNRFSLHGHLPPKTSIGMKRNRL